MANNFGAGQDDFNYAGQSGADFGNSGLPGTPPAAARPFSAQPPRQPEDIFAPVDRPVAAASRPAIFSRPLAAKDNFSSPVAAPVVPNNNFGPPSQAAVDLPAVPPASSGSLKYLIIGILTLVVVLAIAFALYFFVLQPQFQNNQAPAASSGQSAAPVATDINQAVVPPNIATSSEITPTSTAAIAASEPIVATSTESNSALTALLATSTISSVDKERIMAQLATSTLTASSTLDSDGDGLTDYEEIYIYHTDPYKADTDGDGLTDYQEVKIYHTDPNNPDTDGDGYPDGVEVKNGYNPNGPGRLLIVNQK
jgi:hypothetical protein